MDFWSLSAYKSYAYTMLKSFKCAIGLCLKKRGTYLNFKNTLLLEFLRGAAEMNLMRNHEVAGSIPGIAQWIKDPMLP